MKLTIKRDQADITGVFGGHKGVRFSLYAKADVTSNERALIERYKVGEYALATYVLAIKGASNEERLLSVDKLLQGTTTPADTITALLELEDKIKEGCQHLKTLLKVMESFGGEEVIEI
jgi:hypothetical protein